ncbi:hypothetical protein Tco_1565404 [Tanacetum coccineum]
MASSESLDITNSSKAAEGEDHVSKAKSKKRLLFIRKRGKDTMVGKLSHDTLQRKCVDKSQATCRTLMTQTTFKSSTVKLARQILDWKDMMREADLSKDMSCPESSPEL